MHLQLLGWQVQKRIRSGWVPQVRADILLSQRHARRGCVWKQGTHVIAYSILRRPFRSIYFNFDERIELLLLWSGFYFIATSLALKAALNAVIAGRARWPLVLLFAVCLYPNHYGLWCTWNYLNEGFYPMLRTQLYFAVTELLIAGVIVAYVSDETPLHPAGLWAIVSISMPHLVQNWLDQPRPLFGVAIMFYADVVNVAVAAALIATSVGNTFPALSLSQLIRHNAAAATGGSTSWGAMRDAPQADADDERARGSSARDSGKFVYSRALLMQHAAIACAVILVNLVILNTVILSDPLPAP